MNNIRKIIEERLDNAEKHYYNINEIKSPLFKGELKGQIEAYQDCLNLIPAPRTVADILNDFEKLGWKVHRNTKVYLKLEDKYYRQICVNKIDKTYAHTVFIGMQEHKLLNELFEVIFNE